MKSAKSVALILSITLAFSVIGYTSSISSSLYAYAENSQQQKLNEDQNQSYNGTTTSDEDQNQTTTDNETNQQGENETGQHRQNESTSETNSNQQGNDQKSYYNSGEGRGSFIISLGNDSKAGLVPGQGLLGIKISKGDLPDGAYNVFIACTSPQVPKEFSNALNVKNGEGMAKVQFDLAKGHYSDCSVKVGHLSGQFPPFTVYGHEEKTWKTGVPEAGQFHEGFKGTKISVRVGEQGIMVGIMVANINMTDGMHNATFTCTTSPDNGTSINIGDRLKVTNGNGYFSAKIPLKQGAYADCQISAGNGSVILGKLQPFNVGAGEQEQTTPFNDNNNESQDVKNKIMERQQTIVKKVMAGEYIHKYIKHHEGLGSFKQGFSFALSANGTASDHAGSHEDATVNLNATAWKSTRSLLIMDVSGGTVTVGNETYNVHFGYAMVAPQHGLRIMALVSSGNNIGLLVLTGKPTAEGTASFGAMNNNGFTIGLAFGSGEPNKLKTMTDTWDLDLTGTVHANLTAS